ncbi:MAG TPA: HAMP domain-containing sensor histidine kinase [Candidatus Limnocylindrales bacterium]|nr:HAMP domain-containing sensor histidine kinase [Candidatus Limnocylindrales bacterium]
MSLRIRLSLTFALVALATAAVVAVAAPTIVGRGFAQLETTDDRAGSGNGRGQGPGSGPRAQQIERETTVSLIVVAVAAAAGASLLGFILADRISGPLGRLGNAAAAVAHGDLARRSGLAGRSDELGELGRSFDAMARELEAAEAARRRFFQDAVHELKTPLAVIEATTTAVLDRVYDHDDRHLETIRDQSRLLARIVDDLRTIGLAEAGTLPLRIETIDVGAIVGAAIRSFAVQGEAAGLRLDQHVSPGLLVRADPDRLRQMVGALLDNAIRHTPSGGMVRVEGGASSGLVRLSVVDSGTGFRPADLPHVFDRFYQEDPGRDRARGSSGLGLAIVRALAEAQGGRAGAENAIPAGARVWVELPVPTS